MDRSANYPGLTVRYLPLTSLTPYKRNARLHSRKQVQQIADSIKLFGFVNPVLIDANNTIICGHGRVAAAKLLGMKEVPTIALETMSEAQRRAYAIADNQIAELATWDNELLKVELGELSIDFPDLDLTVTGFVTAEIDGIILGGDRTKAASDPAADKVPAITGPTVSRPGDLWLLGAHRLLCGDARDPSAYHAVLGDTQAGMAITDPPFNVKIAGHARRLGRHRHGDFVMAYGEMTEAEFTAFLGVALRQMAEFSAPGAVHFAFIDWRHLFEMLNAGRAIYDTLLNICVWAKGNGGMGSLYRSEHELVLAWRVRGGAHLNNVELGRYGRNRTNIWRYSGANCFGSERDEMLALHPTVKPVAMLADAILDVSKRRDWVLDPFAGSGSTIIAAEKVNRLAAAIEIDPNYVDVAVRRFQEVTGTQARHAESGRTFGEEAAQRVGNEHANGSGNSEAEVAS